jgi:hypothetical protein
LRERDVAIESREDPERRRATMLVARRGSQLGAAARSGHCGAGGGLGARARVVGRAAPAGGCRSRQRSSSCAPSCSSSREGARGPRRAAGSSRPTSTTRSSMAPSSHLHYGYS